MGGLQLSQDKRCLFISVSLSLSVGWTIALEFKPIECEQGMLVETCGKKSIYLPDSWSIQESRILQQTQGAQHIKKCWSQWAKPRYHLSSSVFCSLWTARVTKPLGNTPLWLLHLQLFFSDMKMSSIEPSSIMVDCQTVDERKSHCPEEEDINPSSPFPQLSPRFWPVRRLLPPWESSVCPFRTHSRGCDETILATPSVFTSNRKWKELTIRQYEKLTSAGVTASFQPSNTFWHLHPT